MCRKAVLLKQFYLVRQSVMLTRMLFKTLNFSMLKFVRRLFNKSTRIISLKTILIINSANTVKKTLIKMHVKSTEFHYRV